ncbi:MAG TPA: flagellar basal body P-ring protein FlgI [Spirochaetes bacterium]|nr:flagellar basal body P-ring protein FlgI [Spirochaetota bacterium]
MKKGFIMVALLLPALLIPRHGPAEIKVKVKDLATVDGLKENQIYGYGLVVGLQGSGDSRSALTRSTLKNLLKNMGMREEGTINVKNTAAVMITAKLPPFASVGDKIDITVSSLGDAKSLEGGVLIQSPLRGADDKIYAVAQGSLSVERPAGRRNRPVTTTARILGGAIVERPIAPEIVVDNGISLVIKKWDFSEVDRILKAVAEKYPESKPVIAGGGKIRLAVPTGVGLAEFVSTVENLEISAGENARVVVNQKDGTIVMGGGVKISEALVSREGLTIKVEGTSREGSAALIKETSTVKDLVDTLNAIGASTPDIVSILKALKEAGALHAELIIQ